MRSVSGVLELKTLRGDWKRRLVLHVSMCPAALVALPVRSAVVYCLFVESEQPITNA